MPSTIAAQLYTLREFLKTPADIAATLKKVKRLGFDAVQCSALGPIEAKELAGILHGEGLTCCVTHTSLDKLRDEPQKVIEEHALWGCRYTALGGLGWKEMTADKWQAAVSDFNAVAARYAGSGVSLGYHNHSHELVKYNGTTAMDMLFNGLSSDVWFEIDTYWITHGGGDPAAWIEKCAGRIPCVHLKDMGITAERVQQMREVGEGNLNWPGVLAACRKAGVEWHIIEQDNCNGADPFDCLKTSLENLRAMGVQ
ncbi:MAG TPA: sugar phosphate isomerase/epimerase [Tepidisphaeraceae bacterium]|jgi:sugar phosphate isomerase/epimerase